MTGKILNITVQNQAEEKPTKLVWSKSAHNVIEKLEVSLWPSLSYWEQKGTLE